ncbi:MAG TPA: tetratricopeptide repeat protein [Candidatus Angelobacter sp.]|nr:tetratricopeptide repeat protein [Candidatus Angelobacter sp.]
MNRCFPAFVIAILLLGIVPSHGADGNSSVAIGSAANEDQWIEVQSSHFNVLTDGGEKPGRELAQQFEQLRSAFSQLFAGQHVKQTVPLQIIALRNSRQISQYSRLYQGKPIKSTGFCLRSPDRDYIVLDLGALNWWETVIHEYAHLLLAGSSPDLPAWFNEGFAELYSTIRIDDRHATLGRPPESVLQVLRNETLMPVSSLFRVDRDSPVYNEDSDPRSIFYAESWLVVHYLWDHNEIEQAQRYLQLIRQRVPVAEAVKQAFDMEPEQFDRILQKYSRSGIEAVRIVLPQGLEQASFSVKPVSALDATTALAGLHSHQPDYQEQAIRELQEVLQQDPDNAAAHRDLGYIYYHARDPEEALPHLQKAAEKSPSDWRVHFFWAELTAQKYDDALAPLIEKEARRVIELNPDFADGYGLLGFAFMVERRNPEATAAYQRALALKPASEVYALNLAELYSLQGKLDEARALFLYLQNSGNPVIATAARSHLELMASPKLREE